MKLIVCFIFMLVSTIALAEQSCSLVNGSGHLINIKGEEYINPKTRTVKISFEKYKRFSADYPQAAALEVPLVGECSDKLLIFNIEVYRQLGAFELAHDHQKTASKFTWEKKAFFNGKKQIVFKDGLVRIEDFPIFKMLTKSPEKMHYWKSKFVVKYQISGGPTQVYEQIFDSPIVD